MKQTEGNNLEIPEEDIPRLARIFRKRGLFGETPPNITVGLASELDLLSHCQSGWLEPSTIVHSA